jgi:hypothetical protein
MPVVAFCLRHFLADFIICMCEFDFRQVQVSRHPFLAREIPAHLADPDVAARQLVEIANSVEAVQDGRIYIELINAPFLYEHKGSPAE